MIRAVRSPAQMSRMETLLDRTVRAREVYREAKETFNRFQDFVESRTIEEREFFLRGLDKAHGFYAKQMWAAKEAYLKARREFALYYLWHQEESEVVEEEEEEEEIKEEPVSSEL